MLTGWAGAARDAGPGRSGPDTGLPRSRRMPARVRIPLAAATGGRGITQRV